MFENIEADCNKYLKNKILITSPQDLPNSFSKQIFGT